MEENKYRCPICHHKDLTLRYEASYVYSYELDGDAPGHKNTEEFLSFLYDKREQTSSKTFIECNQCGTQYPYLFLNGVLEYSVEQEGEQGAENAHNTDKL